MYHKLNKHETEMLDKFFIENLSTINKTLNIDMHSLNEHHFFYACQTMFPTWRVDQLHNNGNNIAYLNYITNLNNSE